MSADDAPRHLDDEDVQAVDATTGCSSGTSSSRRRWSSSTMTDDEYAVRRLRCYGFAYVVPWTKLVEDMEEQR